VKQGAGSLGAQGMFFRTRTDYRTDFRADFRADLR
jgi:hypothetical protein